MGSGENIAASSGASGTADSAIKMWTDESKDYDPKNPIASHFTQVVWKNSTSVGCAMAHCELSIFEPLFWVRSFLIVRVKVLLIENSNAACFVFRLRISDRRK